MEPLTRLYDECKKLSCLLEHGKEDVGAARAHLTHYMGKTISEIAKIADVPIDLSCESIDNDGNCKEPDKNSNDDDFPINPQNKQRKKNHVRAEKQETLTLKELFNMTSCTREDITTFLRDLIDSDNNCDLIEIDMRRTGTKGELVRPWLQGEKIPKTKKQMNFFCLLSTSKKEDIRTEYESKESDINDTWIKTLASFIRELQKFNWSNSFENLPANGLDEDDYILLWLEDDDFERNFFNVASSSKQTIKKRRQVKRKRRVKRLPRSMQ